MNRNRSTLKMSIAATLLGAAFCAPASAAIIDFDDTERIALADGESIVSGDYKFRAVSSELAKLLVELGEADPKNAAGGVYNGGLGCGDTPCPSGNASNFYVGVNDGSVTMTSNRYNRFSIAALDFGFLAPVVNVPDGIYGQLRLTGYLSSGGTIGAALDFASQDAGGDFMFKNWMLDDAFAKASLGALSISACMFDGLGGCVNSLDAPAFNQAQFAIDNLEVIDLPEPAMPAMLMLGALGMALSARRRAK